MSEYLLDDERDADSRLRVTLGADGHLSIASQFRLQPGAAAWRTWNDCGITLTPAQTKALRRILNEDST